MTFDEFKDKVRFRETGKHGWTSVDAILDRKPGGNPSPHWCDASPIPNTAGWLLSRYDFSSGVAIFYARGGVVL